MKIVDYLCACNGAPCEWSCREKHLHKKRRDFELCPAAYIKKEKRKRWDRDRDDRDDRDYRDDGRYNSDY